MFEKIINISKQNNKLYIETLKEDGKKWYAYIEILDHKKINKPFICTFLLNDKEIDEINVTKYIGQYIVKKKQLHFEDFHADFNQDVIHITKLEFLLVDGTIIGMTISDIYNPLKNNRLTHMGQDAYINFE